MHHSSTHPTFKVAAAAFTLETVSKAPLTTNVRPHTAARACYTSVKHVLKVERIHEHEWTNEWTNGPNEWTDEWTDELDR